MKNKIAQVRPEQPTSSDSLAIQVLLEKQKLEADKDQKIHFLVQMKAPEKKIDRRPLHLVAAVDNSGSMGSDNKLVRAKESLFKLVEHLTDQDYFVLYVFDNTVTRLQPSGFMTANNKQALIKKIQEIQPGGSTNLSGAYLDGLRCLRETEGKPNAIKRFILFTDGQPNVGISTTEDFLDLVNKQKDETISVSTFGYGRDHAAELLTSISRIQSGNFHFIEQSDQCATAFAMELGGLLSMYGQNLRIKLTDNEGFESSVITRLELDNQNRHKLSDIYGGETRFMTGSIDVKKHDRLPREFTAFKGVLIYDNLVTGNSEEIKFSTKVKFVKADEADKTSVKVVMDQVAFDQAANAHEQAQKLADAGNFAGAQQVILTAASVCDFGMVGALDLQANNYSPESYRLCSASLRDTSNSMRSRRIGTRGLVSNDAPVYASTLNSVQSQTVASFTGQGTPAQDVIGGVHANAVDLPSFFVGDPFVVSGTVGATEIPGIQVGDFNVSTGSVSGTNLIVQPDQNPASDQIAVNSDSTSSSK